MGFPDPEPTRLPIDCSICGAPSLNVFAITIGPPRYSSSKASVKACGQCVCRCRETAIRVCSYYNESTGRPVGDVLFHWFTKNQELVDDAKPLCECTSIDTEHGETRCDFCHLSTSLKIFHKELDGVVPKQEKEEEDQDRSNLLEAVGSPLFLACCRPLPVDTPRNLDFFST